MSFYTAGNKFANALEIVSKALLNRSKESVEYAPVYIVELFEIHLYPLVKEALNYRWVKNVDKRTNKSVGSCLVEPDVAKHTLDYHLKTMLYDYKFIVDNDPELKFEAIFLLFDFLNYCCLEICEPTLFWIYFEEFANMLSVSDLKYIANYISNRFTLLTDGMDSSKGKGLVFLRLCNNNIKRCFALKDRHIASQLNILIATAFPISDRSSFNSKGDFKVEGNIDSFMKNDNDLEQVHSDFGGLQRYFSNPMELINAEHFLKFKSGANWIFDGLENYLGKSKHKSKDNSTSINDPSMDKSIRNLNRFMLADDTKFSADSSQLASQIANPDFQKFILTQMIITLSFIKTLDSELAAKNPPSARPPVTVETKTQLDARLASIKDVKPEDKLPKSFIAFKWNVDHYKWISDRLKESWFLFGRLPNFGEAAARTLKESFRTDNHFALWKQNGCKQSAFDIQFMELKAQREDFVRIRAECRLAERYLADFKAQLQEFPEYVKMQALREAHNAKDPKLPIDSLTFEQFRSENKIADSKSKKGFSLIKNSLPPIQHKLGSAKLTDLYTLGNNNREFPRVYEPRKRTRPDFETYIQKVEKVVKYDKNYLDSAAWNLTRHLKVADPEVFAKIDGFKFNQVAKVIRNSAAERKLKAEKKDQDNAQGNTESEIADGDKDGNSQK